MPDTITEDPEELLAKLLSLAQMKRDGGTGQCGEAGESCFQLFAPNMYVVETGKPAVDDALRALRDDLMTTWNTHAAAVTIAAEHALGGRWNVEWAFEEDGIGLILTKPTSA